MRTVTKVPHGDLTIKRMGLNEYGKRLKTMNSQCHALDRKKQRFSIYSDLLDAFELRKEELAVQWTDPFRRRSRNSPMRHSPMFRTVQGCQGDSGIRLMHVAGVEQEYRPQMNDSRVQKPQITGIAPQGLHFSEGAGDSEQTGNLLHARWMKEKDRLKEEANLKELEEYKRRVQAIDPHNNPVLSETSIVLVKNHHLQGRQQLAGESSLSSGRALDQSTMASGLLTKGPQAWKQMLQESREHERLLKELEADINLASLRTKEWHTSKRPQVWKQMLEEESARDRHIKELEAQIELASSQLLSLQVTQKELSISEQRALDELDDKEMSVAFTPLSKEEEEEVDHALNGHNRHEVLAMHKESNIDITRTVMQCLKPSAWLNDEVINLYMELLRERGKREPKKFLKCHFFNTFFFNKLYKDKQNYDYKAVRRWTTQKKLGYNLLECDKIFIPIHKDIHWCLAIINVRDKKFQYLDSLKGRDRNALQVLAKYLKDEARDKLNQNLDIDTWDQDYPQDIPEQRNGCDCGMFMIKYADFHSRGDHLMFTQEHMEYFRKRTVLEILQLRAR